MSELQMVSLPSLAEIRNDLRKPINSDEREKRISGKSESKLFPYYGATGQVGMIDSYLSDGEYVLVGEDGAPFLDSTKNKAYLITGKAWVNNHAHVLQAKNNISSNRFLLHYLNYFNYEGFVSGTTRLKLTKGKLQQIPVPNFSYNKQLKIVESIDSLFDKIDNSSRELKKTQELISIFKQSILNSAIRGKLVSQDPNDEPASKLLERIRKEKEKLIAEKKIKKEKPLPSISEDEIPFELPEGWEWARLGSLINLYSGQHIEANDYNTNQKGIPYLTGPSDFGPKHPVITKWTAKPKVIAPGNSILVTVKGSGVGKINYLLEKGVCISRQLMAVECLVVNSEYLEIFLHKSFDKLISDAQGLIPGLSREDIENLLCPLPPLKEQERIAIKVKEALSQIEKLSASLEENLSKSSQLKQSILKKAFEGELVQ